MTGGLAGDASLALATRVTVPLTTAPEAGVENVSAGAVLSTRVVISEDVVVFPPPRPRRGWVGPAGLVAVAVLAAAGPWATPSRSSRAAAGLLSASPGTPGPGASGSAGPAGGSGATIVGWVAAENARPGTADWAISGPQHEGDLEGFADAASAQAGDIVRLYVSSKAPTFHVEAYRTGWYGGAGARLVMRSAEVAGAVQPAPDVLAGTRTVETQWVPSVALRVDRAVRPAVAFQDS